MSNTSILSVSDALGVLKTMRDALIGRMNDAAMLQRRALDVAIGGLIRLEREDRDRKAATGPQEPQP